MNELEGQLVIELGSALDLVPEAKNEEAQAWTKTATWKEMRKERNVVPRVLNLLLIRQRL